MTNQLSSRGYYFYNFSNTLDNLCLVNKQVPSLLCLEQLTYQDIATGYKYDRVVYEAITKN